MFPGSPLLLIATIMGIFKFPLMHILNIQSLMATIVVFHRHICDHHHVSYMHYQCHEHSWLVPGYSKIIPIPSPNWPPSAAGQHICCFVLDTTDRSRPLFIPWSMNGILPMIDPCSVCKFRPWWLVRVIIFVFLKYTPSSCIPRKVRLLFSLSPYAQWIRFKTQCARQLLVGSTPRPSVFGVYV